ncbi:MAG TPA: hypothetical protein VFB60_03725 [Ktedonobacteraceae bacterium]|nr:hypothetical protein [Ktedonobacteraceae bacterium]
MVVHRAIKLFITDGLSEASRESGVGRLHSKPRRIAREPRLHHQYRWCRGSIGRVESTTVPTRTLS